MLSIANSGANASRRYNLLAAACQAREPLVQLRQARFFGPEVGCLRMTARGWVAGLARARGAMGKKSTDSRALLVPEFGSVRGLSQRVAEAAIFSWLAYASVFLLRHGRDAEP